MIKNNIGDNFYNDNNIPPQYKGLPSEILEDVWVVPHYVDEEVTKRETQRKIIAIERLKILEEQEKKLKEKKEELNKNNENILSSKDEIKKYVEELNNQGYIFLTHQTSREIAEKINKEGFNLSKGYSGTTLLASADTIMSQIEDIEKGHGHKGSDGMVIMLFKKEDFPFGRSPDSYSSKILDDLIDNNQIEKGNPPKTPLKYHLGYYDIQKGLIIN